MVNTLAFENVGLLPIILVTDLKHLNGVCGNPWQKVKQDTNNLRIIEVNYRSIRKGGKSVS